jgi:hypothetical protein
VLEKMLQAFGDNLTRTYSRPRTPPA